MKTLSEIVLPTNLPNLYIKKCRNLFTTCASLVFLYATTVSPIKLIFYTNNKKAVDLKLQIRISRNNSFSRYLIPKRINVTTFVRYYFSSRSKVFCKKGVLRNFKKRLKRDSSGVLPWILRDFLELLFCIWLSM